MLLRSGCTVLVTALLLPASLGAAPASAVELGLVQRLGTCAGTTCVTEGRPVTAAAGGRTAVAWPDRRGLRYALAGPDGRFGRSHLVRDGAPAATLAIALGARGDLVLAWTANDHSEPDGGGRDEDCCRRLRMLLRRRDGTVRRSGILSPRGRQAVIGGLALGPTGALAASRGQLHAVSLRGRFQSRALLDGTRPLDPVPGGVRTDGRGFAVLATDATGQLGESSVTARGAVGGRRVLAAPGLTDTPLGPVAGDGAVQAVSGSTPVAGDAGLHHVWRLATRRAPDAFRTRALLPVEPDVWTFGRPAVAARADGRVLAGWVGHAPHVLVLREVAAGGDGDTPAVTLTLPAWGSDPAVALGPGGRAAAGVILGDPSAGAALDAQLLLRDGDGTWSAPVTLARATSLLNLQLAQQAATPRGIAVWQRHADGSVFARAFRAS